MKALNYAHSSHWSRVATLVDSSNSAVSKALVESVVDQVGRQGVNNRVLDVAAGDGALVFALASKCNTVVGIDFSEFAISKAREQALIQKRGNSAFVLMDASSLKFPDHSFDAVTFLRSFWVFPDISQILYEVHRVLALDGSLFIQIWGGAAQCSLISFGTQILGKYIPELCIPKNITGPFDYTEASLEEILLKHGFCNLTVKNYKAKIQIRGIDDYWEHFCGLAGTAYLAFTQQPKSIRDAIEAEWKSRWEGHLLRGGAERLLLEWKMCIAQRG